MADFFHILVRTSVDDIVQKFGLYYEATAGGTGPRCAQSAAVAWQANCLTELRACLGAGARVESVYCRKVDGTTAPAWRGNLQDATGTYVGGNAMSAQNCALINLRNSAGLLERPGRIFISGCPKEGLTGGVILGPGTLGFALYTFANKIKTIPAGGTPAWAGELRVRRTIIAGIPQVPPVYVPVDVTDVTQELGTQQKRKGELTGFMP